jgi:hypothetical protein
MRHALILVGAAALEASCGSPPASIDAAADADLCGADAPIDAGTLEVSSDAGAVFCGGTIALAGVTPFGAFAPDALNTVVNIAPGRTLAITVAENPPSGQQLAFQIGADPATGSFVGTHDVTGFLEGGDANGRQVVPVMVHVEVTSATDLPTLLDAGVADVGVARMSITVTTGCGSFSGTLVARYCGFEMSL